MNNLRYDNAFYTVVLKAELQEGYILCYLWLLSVFVLMPVFLPSIHVHQSIRLSIAHKIRKRFCMAASSTYGKHLT